jgi:hypothetical protein
MDFRRNYFKKMIVKQTYKKVLRKTQRLVLAFKDWLSLAVLRMTGAPTLHCIGDSHTAVFNYVEKNKNWRHTRFSYCIVQGATALGLANPHSQTQALPIFQEYLKTKPHSDHLLLCLGEVDCGFVIWYRAQKVGLTVREQFEISLRNYLDFIDWCRSEGFLTIMVCSVPLPTIFDDQDWGEIATNRRKEVKATLRERTDLTREYNRRLFDYCVKTGACYLDLEFETLDPQTQVVKRYYLNSNPLDHHLEPSKLGKVIITKLAEMKYW